MGNTVETLHELLTVNDVMAAYNVSRRTVYRWIERGQLKGKKVGTGKWLFTREAVMNILR